MCRFCAKARISAENDIYSSFLTDLDHEDSAEYEASASRRVDPGGLSALPGSAAWKAKRASVKATAASRGGGGGSGSGPTARKPPPPAMTRAEKREAELCASLRQRRIPTVILTGFLGSGKTTLLNRLLRATRLRLAVIENEVGAVSVDDQLIASSESAAASSSAASAAPPPLPSAEVAAGGAAGGRADRAGAAAPASSMFQPGTARAQEVVLLPNGCMCCRVRGDLRDAFKRIVKAAYAPAQQAARQLQQQQKPTRGLDGLVLELSGLSELGPVVQTFFSDDFVQATLGIDSIVCVIDSTNLRRTLQQGSELIFEQLSLADTVVMNKIDLLEGGVAGPEYAELVAVVRSVNATARLLPLSVRDEAQPLPAAVFGPDAFMRTQAFASGVVLSQDAHLDAVFGGDTDEDSDRNGNDGAGAGGGGSEPTDAHNHHGGEHRHARGQGHGRTEACSGGGDDDHGHGHGHGSSEKSQDTEHRQHKHQHHHDTMGFSSFAVTVREDAAGKPARVDRAKLLKFLDDMHDEGKRLLLATKTGAAARAKLQDTVSPIIRCKGVLRDTAGKRVALQGLCVRGFRYEHHEFFDLQEEEDKGDSRAGGGGGARSESGVGARPQPQQQEHVETGQQQSTTKQQQQQQEQQNKGKKKKSRPQNQLVFIGPITAELQATIRKAVVDCFTNAEAVAAEAAKAAAAKRAAYDANASYFARGAQARARQQQQQQQQKANKPAQPAMTSYRDTSFLKKGWVGGDGPDTLGMDMF